MRRDDFPQPRPAGVALVKDSELQTILAPPSSASKDYSAETLPDSNPKSKEIQPHQNANWKMRSTLHHEDTKLEEREISLSWFRPFVLT